MKILFIYQSLISFVEKDLKILEEAHDVHALEFHNMNDLPSIWQGIQWSDITFSWFGKLNGFFSVLFSKIFRKKSIVIAGGDDVANIPEINYGIFSVWWKRWCPLFVFKFADLILPVSKFTQKELLNNANANAKKVKLLYHGFDSNKFSEVDIKNKDNIAITIGGIDWERLQRKGYERFVKSARFLPDASFILIGRWEDDSIEYLKKIASPNVHFTNRISNSELLNILNKAKVYVQASIHEGFGCSLAEAMLYECVPVVSRKAAIPEVVGDCGFYIDNMEPFEIAAKIELAIKSPSQMGENARKRIMELFPLKKRKEKLLSALETLVSN